LILVDSNVIIYSAKPALIGLREHFIGHDAVFSQLSRLEVLGFHGLTAEDKDYFEAVFAEFPVVPIDAEIIDRAIQIRRSHRTRTADAIIAATALKLDCPLLTADTRDFLRISELKVLTTEQIGAN